MPPQAPRASGRFSGGTDSDRIVSVSGMQIAPPRPWNARAAMSVSADGASAANAEPSVKTVTPTTNSRLRPNRSPSAAPMSRSAAKLSV